MNATRTRRASRKDSRGEGHPARARCGRLVIARLRAVLMPEVQRLGLTNWEEEVVPVLELIDTPQELLEACADPEMFLERLADAA